MKIYGFPWNGCKSRMWLLHQLVASIFCNISAIVIGNCATWLEPFGEELMSSHSEIPMNSNTYSWITSIMEITDLLMSFLAGILVDKWGRKLVLLLTGPLCVISWILAAMNRNVIILYIVRIIQGCAEGIVLTAGPVYLVEMSSPNIRGALVANLTLFFQSGFLYTYLISGYFKYQNFIYLSMILPIIFFCTFLFMPESPYYYLMKRRNSEARKALAWFRADQNVEEELTIIQESVERDMSRKGGFKDLFATKGDRRAFLIVQIVTLSSSLGGILCINQHAKQTFNAAPLLWVTADQLCVIMGITLCISSFITIFLSDTVGRRKLLIISSIGAAIANLIIGIYYFLHEIVAVNVTSSVWVMYIGLLSLCVISNFGATLLVRVVQAEFFPSHTRGIGGGVTGILASLEIFIGLKIYLPLMETFGVYMNFLFYGLINLVSLILTIKYIPESAGKTLQEINKNINVINTEEESRL